MMEHSQEPRRKQAVVRYLAGEKIETICRDMHCSKSWLYKWKARYQADDAGWAKGLSTQPWHKPRQTPQAIAQNVVKLRWTLVQSGKRGSAVAIQQEIKQQGIKPIPSLRTIYRILQRHEQEAI
jgi:putative transposase